MTNTGNDSANKPLADADIGEEPRVYEDEINLMDYFLVLWKYKWFILVCSVLPALIVGVCIYLSPRSYVVTYTYDVRGDVRGHVRGSDVEGDGVRDDVRDDVSNWNLNEKTFNVLQSRFYSEDNLSRIIDKLQTNKLDEYAKQVRGFKADASQFVELKVSPPFLDISKLKVTDPGQIEKLRDMKAFLLNMTITGRPLESLGKIALTIKDNFEEVVPLYMIQKQLPTDIRGYNSKQANIESSRFGLDLDLKNHIEMLTGLKKVNIATLDERRGEVVLQFDIGTQIQYLPVSYQIQALESKILELEWQVNENVANYQYYGDLSDLSARLVAELNDKLSSSENYTIELFISFLADLIRETEKQELKNYLASYIKKIENRMSQSKPIIEKPKIQPIAKRTVKKSSMVFYASLATSIFISLIINGIQKAKS